MSQAQYPWDLNLVQVNGGPIRSKILRQELAILMTDIFSIQMVILILNLVEVHGSKAGRGQTLIAVPLLSHLMIIPTMLDIRLTHLIMS